MVDEDKEDRQLVRDAGVIGRNMLKAIDQLAKEQNRPTYDFIQAAIQALIAVNSFVLEEDPSFTQFKKEILS